MGFLKEIKSFFASHEDKRNLWFSVRCEFCQEILQGRVDMQNDLSIVYGSDSKESGYYCRKILIGSNRCYRPIEVEFNFDTNRKITNRRITGGKFVGEDG